MEKRKFCIITGTRAEYGLFYWLMKEIETDQNLELQIIATNMHLSPEFGLTYKQIEADGFKINKKIENLLSSDTDISICKSTALTIISLPETLKELNPDIVILLGDRYETLAAAICAHFLKIPIAHISGGETTQGAIDEAIRHSITKMSSFHFTSTQEYQKRVIQLGENPKFVYNVGAIAIDNIKNLKLLEKEEFERQINFKLNKKNILITYHPVTLENISSEQQFTNLLQAIDNLKDTNIIFTKPNSDTDGRIISKLIDKYVSSNPQKAISFISMGQLKYLSAMQFVDAVVGNSSSGIVEAPSFKIGTINIGDRQKGRICAQSVINCQPTKEEILKSFEKLYSQKFQQLLKNIQNPYGNGGTSKKIIEILKKIDLNSNIKKEFYDIKFSHFDI